MVREAFPAQVSFGNYVALLLKLVLIFTFQLASFTHRWLAVPLIAVPIIIQAYVKSGLAY